MQSLVLHTITLSTCPLRASSHLDIIVSAVHLVLDFESREPETDVITFLRGGQSPVAIFVVVIILVAVGGV